MYQRITLNGTWYLSWSEDAPESLVHDCPEGHYWLPARVPAPIHSILVQEGIIEDPNFGLNSLKARWVEEQFWVYRTQVDVADDVLGGSQWLVFDWLEHAASVWVNGVEVGRHANSHRRAVLDVTGRLRAGENTLVVVVESGLHHVHDVAVDGYAFDRFAQITRRPLLRKAQYQCGWDWNPRLMNVGILGDVELECSTVPVLHEVALVPTVDRTLTRGTLTCRVFLRHPRARTPGEQIITVSLPELGVSQAHRVEREDSADPVSRHELVLNVGSPQLWWPNGHGEQKLYDVEVTLRDGEERCQTARRRVGFRHVEVDQSPHPDGGRFFVLRINHRPVFCKGGNWVPPDLLPSRVAPERYESLVCQAVEANFNTLRVWGGGVFAPEALLEACDRHGLLIWHDFLFACARYPGDDPAFTTEVETEVQEAVRRMAHHPSLVVWCGNNEVEWGDREWGYRDRKPLSPHHALFHHHIPAILAREDGSRFYWPSSPWSPDYESPNAPHVGDQHPWGVSILDPGPADFHRYRTYTDRFPNEGGVLGAALPITLRDFLPASEIRQLSPSWVHHDNPIAFRASRPGERGRVYETFCDWTGSDPLKLAVDEYAMMSGLLQAEGLCEYIANYRRRMYSSASAIFWMYNDSWPATHSWAIVDYYLRRRLAYHPVRRAFQPITVVVADEGSEIVWYGVNDSPKEWSGSLRYGVCRLAGGYPIDELTAVSLPPCASVPMARLPAKAWEDAGTRDSAAFGLLLDGDQILAWHRLFRHRFRELRFQAPAIRVTREDDRAVFQSDTFAWGVCIDTDGAARIADNCFDLLPTLRYTLPWSDALGEPRVAWVGSGAIACP